MDASVKRKGSTSPASDWKVTVEALIRGARDSATLLSSLLQDHAPGSPTRVLTEEILSSISQALVVLDTCEKSAVPWTSNPSPPFSDNRQNEVSSSKRKIIPFSDNRQNVVSSSKRKIIPARRVYKSRSQPYSCTTITTKAINDAYSWRKYGQKPIYNATYPRSYYRCTHKTDRGCRATRQVQQSEEDPTMFVINYMGEHTCGSDPNKASTSESFFLSFGSGTTEPMMLPPLPLPKLDFEEEVVSSASPLGSSLSEELGLPGIMAVEASEPSPPTLSLLSEISFDFSRGYLDMMSNTEFISIDELLKDDVLL